MPIYPGMHSTVDSPQLGKPEASGFNNFEDRSLKLAKTAEMVVKYQDSQGRARIKGGKGLKSSQAYPFKFFGIPKVYLCFRGFPNKNINMLEPKPLVSLDSFGKSCSLGLRSVLLPNSLGRLGTAAIWDKP